LLRKATKDIEWCAYGVYRQRTAAVEIEVTHEMGTEAFQARKDAHAAICEDHVPIRYIHNRVVDDQMGRAVPLVALRGKSARVVHFDVAIPRICNSAAGDERDGDGHDARVDEVGVEAREAERGEGWAFNE